MKVITFRSYLVKIVIPTIVIVIALNLVLEKINTMEPMKVIRNAQIAGKFDLAQKEYARLIDGEFYNLEYHRGYIRCKLPPIRLGPLTIVKGKSDIEEVYGNYAKDADRNIADIGNYGLGFFYGLRFENEKAMSHLNKIQDHDMSFLNNTIGAIHLASGRRDLAKAYFYKEINNYGYLEGAYANLAIILYDSKEFDELNALLKDRQALKYIPAGLKRQIYFTGGDWFLYLKETMSLEHVQFPGLVAAFLITLAWFLYLRRLGVFEPEKFRHLLVVLLGGCYFRCFAVCSMTLSNIAWVSA